MLHDPGATRKAARRARRSPHERGNATGTASGSRKTNTLRRLCMDRTFPTGGGAELFRPWPMRLRTPQRRTLPARMGFELGQKLACLQPNRPRASEPFRPKARAKTQLHQHTMAVILRTFASNTIKVKDLLFSHCALPGKFG